MILAIILIALVALFLITAWLAPKNYSIERSIVINRPIQEVFGYLKLLKNQDQYSKWVRMDPAMKKTYEGVDGTEGFVFSWDGNKKAGAGKQRIRQIRENELLDVEVEFIRPFAGIAGTPFSTTAITPTQTRVTWGMHSSMKYPLNIVLLFMNMDKMLGKDIETSLEMLKTVLENR